MLLLKCSEKNKMRVTVTSLSVAKTTEALVKILFYTLKHVFSKQVVVDGGCPLG